MKIYTKTGDEGQTSLFGAGRVDKDHPRIAVVGALDELNALLGVARSQLDETPGATPEGLDDLLRQAQNLLFDLGAEIASPQADPEAATLAERHVDQIEQAIDRHEERLEPLRQFILPGGVAAASHLHLARCVCRRAERELVSLSRGEGTVRPLALRYLNRLSDLLFVLARAVNQSAGKGDTPWTQAP